MYWFLPECITGGDENATLVLNQPEADLCQVGGLSDAVDAAEGHDVRPLVGLGLDHVADDVDPAFGRQKLHQGLRQGVLHRPVDRRESA